MLILSHTPSASLQTGAVTDPANSYPKASFAKLNWIYIDMWLLLASSFFKRN
jgi:hypothetical protein